MNRIETVESAVPLFFINCDKTKQCVVVQIDFKDRIGDQMFFTLFQFASGYQKQIDIRIW